MCLGPATKLNVGDFVEFIHPVKGSTNVQEVIKVVKKRRTKAYEVTVQDTVGRRLKLKYNQIMKVINDGTEPQTTL